MTDPEHGQLPEGDEDADLEREIELQRRLAALPEEAPPLEPETERRLRERLVEPGTAREPSDRDGR